jgi:hypothetical protein
LRSKNFKLYSVYLLLCFFIPILVLEIGLRFATFPSGIGVGSASQRWLKKNWSPINSDGYRDVEFYVKPNKPAMLFLGDSFTAGHGVRFTETYYFAAREKFLGSLDFVNLGQNGASTKEQERNLDKFFSVYDSRPRYVVHQYFGNDIEDYIEVVKVERSFLRQAFSRVSELFNFIDTYFYMRDFGSKYVAQLMSTYENQNVLEKHFSDLKKIHEKVYRRGGQIIFIVFPFLNNDESLKRSSVYVHKIKESFLISCRNGDILIDVTPIASYLQTNDRVVNFMDAHPSPRLHQIVADLLIEIFNGNRNLVEKDGVAYCIK